MNNLIVNGKQEFMGMEIPIIEGGFGEGQKVILAKTVAEIHNVEIRELNQLINNNLEEFNNDVDILDLAPIIDNDQSIKKLLLSSGYSQRGITATINQGGNFYLLSQRGYLKLVAMMSNSNSTKWEVMNNLIDEYFTLRAKEKSGQSNFKTTEDIIIYQMQEQKKMKEKLKEQDTKINESKRELIRMKDCIISDINKDNWRDECRKVLFKTACRMAFVDDELDRDDYLSTLHELAWKLLKERMRCNVNARLKHIKERMLANGATKTQVSKLNRLDVLEQDNKLKSAYIAIVKEISIKH